MSWLRQTLVDLDGQRILGHCLTEPMRDCGEEIPRGREASPSHEKDMIRSLRIRLWIVGIASSAGYLSFCIRVGRHPVVLLWGFPLAEFLTPFLFHFAFLFLLALIAAGWTFRARTDDRGTLGLILGFALLFRLLLLPTPPVLSSDIFRYIWDARVQASGINPYLSRPADFDTEANRKDPIYQQQNRPFARTIYPPLAQVAFRITRSVVGESVTVMKGLMVMADLCSLALLSWLLPSMGLPRSRVILYAWHPLVIFEYAGSGHVDALAVPLILLAVLSWQRNHRTVTGIALGAATLVKIYPVFLLPAFFERRRWQLPLACAITIAVGYLPFVSQAGLEVLGHLPRFLVDPQEVFNPSLMGLVFLLGDDGGRILAFWLWWIGCAALLAILILLVRKDTVRPSDVLRRIWVIGTGLVLLARTFHPWYLLWLLPFLTIEPRPAWIYLSGAVALSYLFYMVPPPVSVAIGVIEYLPFLLLLAWQRGRFGILHGKGHPL